MITFLICLTLLVTAYFTYGRYVEQLSGLKPTDQVPSATMADGVDYVPLPLWKTFMIQLLNIAGAGPIFGAILGAAYGPVAFVWITLGGIFFGAVHDFFSGYMSIENGGMSLPEVTGKYLGRYTRLATRILSIVLLVTAGAVFASQPAELLGVMHESSLDHITALTTVSRGAIPLDVLLIFVAVMIYYLLSTILPIDKLIGRLYPLFGGLMFVMTFAILVVLLKDYSFQIPELTSLRNGMTNAAHNPIIPCLFITIACGALSGFHATQSPMMARCLGNTNQCRKVFYGAMISESVVALVWAAMAMAFWNGVEGLNAAVVASGGSAAVMVEQIASTTLGRTFSTVILLGVIACIITSGDTAFRGARLILADLFMVDQRKVGNRLNLALPLFAVGAVLVLWLPFIKMWSYCMWVNQILATITLLTIVTYQRSHHRQSLFAFLPALFMLFSVTSFFFISPLFLGMENHTAGYVVASVLSAAYIALVAFKAKRYAPVFPTIEEHIETVGRKKARQQSR